MIKEITGVFGITGSGKTKWLEKAFLYSDRSLVIENGNEEFIDIADFSCYSQQELANNMINRGKFKIIYISNENDIDGLDEMLEVAKAYTQNIRNRFKISLPLSIFIDEAQNYSSPWKTSQILRKSIMQSRHFDFSIFYSTQRPSQISRSLTSQSKRFIIFKIAELSDIKFFYGFIGKETKRIADLKLYHFLDCNLSKNIVIEKMLNID